MVFLFKVNLDSPLCLFDELLIDVDFSAGCKLSLVVIVFFLFVCVEIGEIYGFQYSSQMVLVSPPEGVVQGVICKPEAWWNVSGGSRRSRPLPYGPARQEMLSWCAVDVADALRRMASERSAGGQKTQALVLATACIWLRIPTCVARAPTLERVRLPVCGYVR